MISVPCPNDCGATRWANCEKYAAVVADRLCRKCYLAAARSEPAEPVELFVDEMAVEALLAGRRVRTNAAERATAVAYLTERRESAHAIANRPHMHQRSIVRLRHRIRETA